MISLEIQRGNVSTFYCFSLNKFSNHPMGIRQMYLLNKQAITLKNWSTRPAVQAPFSDLLLTDEVYWISALCDSIYSRECRYTNELGNFCLQFNLIGLNQGLSGGLICENKSIPGEIILLLVLLRLDVHKYKKRMRRVESAYFNGRKVPQFPQDHEQVTFIKHYLWAWCCPGWMES